MQKFLNSPETLLAESLAGLAGAHSDILKLGSDGRYVCRRQPVTGKVALISGGGAGHEPLHAGFVGLGMLDAACPGQVFTSPTPDQMLAAIAAVDGGAGVLFIVKNYAGDVMNFEMAAEMASEMTSEMAAAGSELEILTVLTNDDVAVEESTWSSGRRGVAGTLVVEKLLGAAAEQGMGLADLKALGDRTNSLTRTMGVALSSCTVPAAGTPTFNLGEAEIEMGVGIHGEPGRRRQAFTSADAITDELLHAICDDLAAAGLEPGDILLFINGFGGTPLMELHLLYNAARHRLEQRGFRVQRSLVGSYVNSLEMAGASITVSLLDGQALRLWDAPVHTAALRWGC
ncbi:dihydroxyacetone kinase subunit DhaK [Synechococcus sp. CBW1108]|uniref:dihydroxyacetone kinase subunit DhaK n=1 Tax=Synechococcus sp. CBW1108 TaxID=1353147 RepID=UPI0018CD7678|nr:dihydroxyacetone kinase subunit DhaK [Synechococcus sp. CBW1108]QPN71064.1 dihydroxyacetone kinase subunit DhaK [Synechococcus sp. CBW1108]